MANAEKVQAALTLYEHERRWACCSSSQQQGRYALANRRTVPPPLFGCKSAQAPRLWFSSKRPHVWNYSVSWNGNSKAVLPFADSHTRGIARSGYRCYHCGQFAWDDDDISYALRLAYSWGLVKVPTGETDNG